jgi:hypothetical protein
MQEVDNVGGSSPLSASCPSPHASPGPLSLGGARRALGREHEGDPRVRRRGLHSKCLLRSTSSSSRPDALFLEDTTLLALLNYKLARHKI